MYPVIVIVPCSLGQREGTLYEVRPSLQHNVRVESRDHCHGDGDCLSFEVNCAGELPDGVGSGIGQRRPVSFFVGEIDEAHLYSRYLIHGLNPKSLDGLQFSLQGGRAVELVGANDTTLSGSRNGLTPLMLWYAINRHGEDGWRETVRGMLDTAEYAVQRFNEHGINAWRHRNSPTVVFDRPSQEVFDRWQIAPEGEVAHIITMPHVDFETIDRLVADCSSPQTELPQEHDLPPAETAFPTEEQQTEPAHATTMQRIVIMAENRIGVIAQIAGTLAEGGVNLNSIATENEGQHGVVIITTDRTDHALAILNEAGFKAVSDEAVLVQLLDQPGALANLASELTGAGLNIRTFHIIERRENYATAAITTDDQERAKMALASRYTVI